MFLDRVLNKKLKKAWRAEKFKRQKTSGVRKISRNSKAYKLWRLKVFKRDNRTCQHCGSVVNIQAHHIKEQAQCPDLRLILSNGITICKECHIKIHPYMVKYYKTEKIKRPKQIKKVKPKLSTEHRYNKSIGYDGMVRKYTCKP